MSGCSAPAYENRDHTRLGNCFKHSVGLDATGMAFYRCVFCPNHVYQGNFGLLKEHMHRSHPHVIFVRIVPTYLARIVN